MPAPNFAFFTLVRSHVAACLAIVLVIIILASGFGFHRQITHQLNAWKLLPQPERLTELYFTQPNILPTKYTPGQTQTVSFTVHNLEYRATSYTYQIIEHAQNGTPSTTLATGSFHLPQNAFARPTVRISLVDLGPRVKVEVLLSAQHESIDYWVGETV